MAIWAWLSRSYRTHRRKNLTKHLSGNVLRRVAKLLVVLVILILINSVAMVTFEKMSIGDATWLSFTTLTTVGYGDFSPATLPGRMATIFTMYGFAITMLSLVAAEVIEWRLDKTEKKRKGLWEWKDMSGHIQIINTPNVDTERFLYRLVKEIQSTRGLSDLPIQLLTRKYPDGLPDSLTTLKLLHRTGAAEDGVALNKINLPHANYIVILARDSSDSLSDSATFDTLSRVVQINPSAVIVAEAVLDENRQRFLDVGAKAVLRPMRAYPEMIARAMSHPGTERVLEEFFDSNGGSIHRVPCSFEGVTWGQVVIKCIECGVGTPLAYFYRNSLFSQPAFDTECTGDALAVLINEANRVDLSCLEEAFVKT